MGKYITKFETQTLFDEAKDNLDKPHVSLTMDNNTVHYLEQPVVRPLKKLELNEVVPLLEQSREKEVMFVIRNFFDTNDVVSCMYVNDDGSLEMILIGCDIKEVEETATLVNASDVTETILVKECPCYSNYVSIEDLISESNAFMQILCDGTEIVPDMMVVEMKEGEWSDWGNRRITFVIEK